MPVDEPVRDLPSILVVDDDEISLGIICMMLDAEGYRVLQAGSGQAAVKIAAESKEGLEPAIVLADLQMPGLCGRELALALRTLLPRAMIIAMSATPSPVEAYDGFVEKPLDLAALRRKTLRTSLENGTGSVDIQPAVQKNIPVLDERVHRKLQRTIPPAALAEVYEVCLKDARSRAEEMLGLLHECSEGSGFPSIRRSAHAIKGGAGMIGASMLASAAAKLELGSYMRDDVPGLINNLLHCCDQLQRILMSKSETTG